MFVLKKNCYKAQDIGLGIVFLFTWTRVVIITINLHNYSFNMFTIVRDFILLYKYCVFDPNQVQ